MRRVVSGATGEAGGAVASTGSCGRADDCIGRFLTMASSAIERVLIVGTGLIGASTGLALRRAGFAGRIDGWDVSSLERAAALQMGAVDGFAADREAALELARAADVIVLAVPVLAIKDWMQQLGPVLRSGQLVTDVGSTKLEIAELGSRLFGGEAQAEFLPGHPMAGKESGGAMLGSPGSSMGRCGCLRRPRPSRVRLNRSGGGGWASLEHGRWIWMRRDMMRCVHG